MSPSNRPPALTRPQKRTVRDCLGWGVLWLNPLHSLHVLLLFCKSFTTLVGSIYTRGSQIRIFKTRFYILFCSCIVMITRLEVWIHTRVYHHHTTGENNTKKSIITHSSDYTLHFFDLLKSPTTAERLCLVKGTEEEARMFQSSICFLSMDSKSIFWREN